MYFHSISKKHYFCDIILSPFRYSLCWHGRLDKGTQIKLATYLGLCRSQIHGMVACSTSRHKEAKNVLIQLLQIWGAAFYLLNKVFWALAERKGKEKGRKLHICAWVSYLAGHPAWWAAFALKHNWIVFGLGIGGLPSTILGLVIAVRGQGKDPLWLKSLALISAAVGFYFSIHEMGGIVNLRQGAEIGMSVTYLVGTYLLAIKKPAGYISFILLNIFSLSLMWSQGYLIMAIQQILSIFFLLDAYIATRRQKK